MAVYPRVESRVSRRSLGRVINNVIAVVRSLKYVSLSGAGQFGTTPASIPLGTQHVLAFWVRPRATGWPAGGETGNDYLFYTDSGNVYMSIQATGLFQWLVTERLDRWTHFGIVRNAGSAELFVNGVSKGTAAGGTATASLSQIAKVVGSNALNGDLSDFRLYTGLKTAAQMKAMFEEKADLVNAVAIWPMDDGEGLTARNLVSGGHEITWNGVTHKEAPSPRNLISNPEFVGAVAGSPGTAPNRWTFITIGTASLAVAGETITFSVTSGRHMIFSTYELSPGTYSFEVTCEAISGTVQSIWEHTWLNTALPVTYYLDGVAVPSGATLVPHGTHTIRIELEVSAVSTIEIRMGAGLQNSTTHSASYTAPRFYRHKD